MSDPLLFLPFFSSLIFVSFFFSVSPATAQDKRLFLFFLLLGRLSQHHHRPVRRQRGEYRISPCLATSTKALYDDLGLFKRHRSTIFTQSNQYRVIWRRIRHTYRSVDSFESIYVSRRAGASVPLSADSNNVDCGNSGPTFINPPFYMCATFPATHRIIKTGLSPI